MVRAIVVNSGNANSCTGEQGVDDAKRMAALAAEKLGLQPAEVLVASTGVIGVYLPLDKIARGVELAAAQLSPNGGTDAAQAIMTTDTVKKESAFHYSAETEEENYAFVIGGMAKGSGMTCPDMATMLAFLATDVNADGDLLQEALREAVDCSFNLISVDGDTSTNDMVLLLSCGDTGAKLRKDSAHWPAFKNALIHICQDLAYKVISDGEGVTKVIKLTLKGAVDYPSGRRLARAVLNSNLVKTAFFGEDANWGRIASALGSAGVELATDRVDIFLGDVQVMAAGKGLVFDEAAAKAVLAQAEVPVLINLNLGNQAITAWGNDLSHDYISINTNYRS
jgi:glutamate N-acetyltransferase/amino-acid N-acetyltransferase